jgi:RHS repeat-associated protein
MYRLKLLQLLILAGVLFYSPGTSAQLASPALIQVERIKISGITGDNQIYPLTTAQKQTEKTYLDGFGRPIQDIQMAASPSGKDVVSYGTYGIVGANGPQITRYLPYVGVDGAGEYHTSAATEQVAFFSNGLSDKVIDDAKPWSQSVGEASPLGRPLYAGTEGNGFQPIPGSDHYKTINSRTNNSSAYVNDSYNTGIRLWNYDGTSSGVYPTGSLTVAELTDESNNVTIQYNDANNRMVLKRQIISQVIDGIAESCLDTYYIYDNAGELLYIVPPKALVAIRNANPNPWSVSIAAATPMTYNFVYDAMARLIQKKVPGADWMYFVYDPFNRPVLVQDGNRRPANQWLYLKYDVKGRVISQGIYTDATHTTLSSMQSYVSGLAGTVYATYYYEEKQPGGTAPNYYTNRIFPTSNYDGSGFQDLLYNYFDDYDFNDDGTPDYAYTPQGLSNEATQTALTRSAPTGAFKRTLNNDGTLNVWLRSVSFYDKHGNLIQVLSNNHTNVSAADTKTNVPNFIGQSMQIKVSKTVNAVTTSVLVTDGYDQSGRLTTIDQQTTYNGVAGPAVRVANYIFNEIGQLVNKKLHSTDQVNYMQNVDFRYNINGHLTSINNATLTVDNTNYTNADANDIFGEEILYEKSDATGLGNSSYYNGNISAVKWKDLPPSPGNTNERSYVYTYDQLSRLTAAHYSEWNSGSGNWNQAVGYNDENVTAYDHNGNIEALTRYSNSAVLPIDNLTYSYNGNQLTNVTDATGNSSGFNGANSSPYVYDNTVAGNGNLTGDPKKGITISYNVLNRTDKILFSNGNYIRYTYDAGGAMLRKETYNGTTTTYDYIDGFVYQSQTLSYFATAEGRVRNSSGTLTYEYFIRDHLGNIRVSFDGTGGTAVVRQENSFYPFGMNLPGNYQPSQPNNNLFNGGSEWQNDFTNLPDYYETPFRNYDPELGRFISVDPIASQSASLTPYHFAGDNPISFNDPTGLRMIYLGSGLWQDETGATYDNSDLMVMALGNGATLQTLYDASDPNYGGAAGAYVTLQLLSGNAVSADAQFATFIQSVVIRNNNETNADNPNVLFNGVTATNDGFDVSYTNDGVTKSYNYSNYQAQSDLNKLLNLYDIQTSHIWDYVMTGIQIAGGVFETAVGSVTTEFGVGAFLMVDGVSRTMLASAKMYTMATHGVDAAKGIPKNLGGVIGYGIDVATGNDNPGQGKWQDALSLTNDFTTLFMSGGVPGAFEEIGKGAANFGWMGAARIGSGTNDLWEHVQFTTESWENK